MKAEVDLDNHGLQLNLGDEVTVEGRIGIFTYEGYHCQDKDQVCVRAEGSPKGHCDWAERRHVSLWCVRS